MVIARGGARVGCASARAGYRDLMISREEAESARSRNERAIDEHNNAHRGTPSSRTKYLPTYQRYIGSSALHSGGYRESRAMERMARQRYGVLAKVGPA